VKAVEEHRASGAAVTFAAFRNALQTRTKGEAKKKRPICERLLAAGADPNLPAPAGHASIMDVAAGSASPEILQLLIDAGGRVDVECPVHTAVGWNQPDNVRVLLVAGANPNVPLTGARLEPDEPIAGMTALEYARHLRHKKCVEVLNSHAEHA
jgi:hypothetical protein